MLLVAVAFSSMTAQAGIVRGMLENGDSPYIIKADNGAIYKAEWYGGTSLWFEGDSVILTRVSGQCQMISPEEEKTSEVWVEEI